MKTPLSRKASPSSSAANAGSGGRAEPPPHIKAAAVLRNRAGALLQAGRPVEAEALLREAIAIFPGFAEAEIRIGNIRRGMNDLDGAGAAYRRALAIKPDYPWAHLELAICLQRGGQGQAALTHYRAALRHNPKLYKTVLFAMVDQQNGTFWLDIGALKRQLLDNGPDDGGTARGDSK
jgi:tetratricopeptide (TPR) repeat protein